MLPPMEIVFHHTLEPENSYACLSWNGHETRDIITGTLQRWVGINRYTIPVYKYWINNRTPIEVVDLRSDPMMAYGEDSLYEKMVQTFPMRLLMKVADSSFMLQDIRWGPTSLRVLHNDPENGFVSGEVVISKRNTATTIDLRTKRIDPRWYTEAGRWINSETAYMAQEGWWDDLVIP